MNGISLSKNAIVKYADLTYCPLCKKPIPINPGESVKETEHWQRNHAPINPGFKEIEEFKYEPEQSRGELTGETCPNCKKGELVYFDDQEWPYIKCNRCNYWEDANDIPPSIEEAPQGEPGLEDIFKDCPKCGAEMDVFDAETAQYWICEKCGHNERINEKEPPAWLKGIGKSYHPQSYMEIKDVVGKYPIRSQVIADQITPNIWLGDVVNGWFMRDKGTGKPFDAILNVSQHTYTPPPDVAYEHIPIDEHGHTDKSNKSRIRDIAKAVAVLDEWTNQGKNVYLHCSEGMNRSPSVLAAYLYKKELSNVKDPSEAEKEKVYDNTLEQILEKRFIASPYGYMEDSLREYLGLPPAPTGNKFYAPSLKGGWFAPEKRKKPLFTLGEHVNWGGGEAGKEREGIIISSPLAHDPNSPYWVKDLETGGVAMLKADYIRKKNPKKKEQARYYPGEKGIMQTHPKFPPPGGIIRRKPKKAISKRVLFSSGFRRGGENIIPRFIRRAIVQSEMYNFYAVMQLPPAFFDAFPKWKAYAEEIVKNVAEEYAQNLEKIVRTEAVDTHGQRGGDDEESEHEHSFSSDSSQYHSCDDCGYKEGHRDWNDDDESGHTCGVCGDLESHDFDSDHECSRCGGSYEHTWALIGDQEYRCESTEDENGEYHQGCGAETDFLPKDEQTPFFGDFDEERHRHSFHAYPITEGGSGGDPVRCTQCGRAFLDFEGSVQEQLPGITPEKVRTVSPERQYYENQRKKEQDLIDAHKRNPSLHNYEYSGKDWRWDDQSGEWKNVNLYRCKACGAELALSEGQQPPPGIRIPGQEQETRERKRNFKDWKQMVVSGKCPNCAPRDVKLADTGEGFTCPKCFKQWDYNGMLVTAGKLSLRQILAQPARKRRYEEPFRFPPETPMPYKKAPVLNIDTSKWFDFYIQDPEMGKWIPWSQLRSQFKPREWRPLERYIIENPESVLSFLTASPSGAGLMEQIDESKLSKFKQLVQLKKHIINLGEEGIREALERFKKYPQFVRSDADEIFESIFGVKSLYATDKPDEQDAMIFKEIQPEINSAWGRFTKVLGEYDPEAAEFYNRYKEAPKPEWAAQAADMSNRVTIAKGTGTSPGIATGQIAITADMALQMAGSGKVILVRPETTPEDIGAMRAAAGFLTAHGGPTAHAAIVARQMGKPCITGAGFTINNDVITFPGGRTVEVGKTITIDGRSGEVSVSEKSEEAAPSEIEEVHVEPPQEGESWDDEFEKILELDKLMQTSKSRSYDYEDLNSMDLSDLAQVFNTRLHVGAYGGPKWALAAIRAKQLQESINLGMPWRYWGMLVDQINTLQHNSGNIFEYKPWPGKPGNWVNDVLDTKGSEHAMFWIENEKDNYGNDMLTDETKAMLRDYRRWARREGYPSLYGTDISQMTPDQLYYLKQKEKAAVRSRREVEKDKWAARGPVVVIKNGHTITALHRVSGAKLLFYTGEARKGIHSLFVPENWRGKGIARWLSDSISRLNG